VKELLNKKRSWIERELQGIANRRRVFDGKQLLLRGVSHKLKVVSAGQNSVKVKGRTVFVGIADGSDLRQCVRNWMTIETRRYAAKRVNDYRRKLGLDVEGVEVGDSRRWGHCTHDRKLVFSWQLAALPRELAEYVVLHEISHLSEFNHNGRFRVLLFSLCPDFREREQALRSIAPWVRDASAS
jgi:predicted metal-dependent hydrolase